MFVCNICNSFAGQSYSAVLRHMGNHRFDPGLSIVCGIDFCVEVYKNYESFRSHVYRKHREVLGSCESTQAEGSIPGISQIGDTESREAHNVALEEEETMMTDEDYDPKKSAALFLLKTREERKVTQTALNGIVQDIQGLWKDAMERIKVSFQYWYELV